MSKQITDLQTHLGALTVCYYDLKNKLFKEFGDKFKSSVVQPAVTEGFSSVPIQPAYPDNPVDLPPPRTARVVDLFEKEPVGTNTQITIRQEKRMVSA